MESIRAPKSSDRASRDPVVFSAPPSPQSRLIDSKLIARVDTSIPDFEHAGDLIAKAVGNYNDRPHYAVKGLTPNQVYSGMIFDTGAYREKLRTARLARMEENRRSCNPCLLLDLESEEKAGDAVVE